MKRGWWEPKTFTLCILTRTGSRGKRCISLVTPSPTLCYVQTTSRIQHNAHQYTDRSKSIIRRVSFSTPKKNYSPQLLGSPNFCAILTYSVVPHLNTFELDLLLMFGLLGSFPRYKLAFECHDTREIRYAALGASNGIALALDLDDPSECPELEEGGEQVRQPVRQLSHKRRQT